MANWLFLKKIDIKITAPSTGVEDLYLRRWVIARTPWFQVMLHKILRPDPDNDLHDHPWSFRSFILKGGYVEQVQCKGTVCTYTACKTKMARLARTFTWAGHDKNSFHRIAELFNGEPAWTLVFTGPKRKGWGFLVDGKHVPWREYLRAKGQPVTEDIGDDW